MGLLIGALTLTLAYASYRISQRQGSPQLYLLDPGEQAIEIGDAVVYTTGPGNVTLVAEDSVTCGHVLRLVNDGGVAASIGTVRASLRFGVAPPTIVELHTSEGAAMYDSTSIALPAGLSRVAIYVLPDQAWPAEPGPSFWDVAIDLPFSVEGNSATDIKVGLTFFFANGHPPGLDSADFDMYDPVQWSISAVGPLLPFSVSYQLLQENGTGIDGPAFSCFDGVYVRATR